MTKPQLPMTNQAPNINDQLLEIETWDLIGH
jgi:hypothetical protein